MREGVPATGAVAWILVLPVIVSVVLWLIG